MLGRGTKRSTLSTTAHGAAYVAQRAGTMTTRNGKLSDRLKLRLESIDELLKLGYMLLRDWGNLTFTTLAYGQESRNGHKPTLNSLQLLYKVLSALIINKFIGKQGDECG